MFSAGIKPDELRKVLPSALKEGCTDEQLKVLGGAALRMDYESAGARLSDMVLGTSEHALVNLYFCEDAKLLARTFVHRGAAHRVRVKGCVSDGLPDVQH